jgi:hypothetical protein
MALEKHCLFCERVLDTLFEVYKELLATSIDSTTLVG